MAGLLDVGLALVSGAGSGIGEGIAIAMAKEGARIIAVDVDEASAARVAKAIGGAAASRVCDVSDRKAVDGLAASVRRDLGAIAILVNNPGIIRRGKITDPHAREDWHATLAL